jgi:pimeloyl-ACP methyl ester carboxylesterase
VTTVLKALGVIVAVLAVVAVAAWLKLRGPDIPYAELEAKYSGAGSGFVDLAGGLRMHYQESGDASAPPVVLLHGFGDSFTSWEGWVPVLAAEYRVIAVDLPGHGLTRAPQGYRLTTAGLVDSLEAFAAARGLASFALAGNSLGGGVAWSFALKHPERLSALILVDAGGWPQKPAAHMPLAFRILRYRIGRWFLSHIDNRPLIADGLKDDVYDPAVITPAFIDRWAEFQRAPGHRAILMSLTPTAMAVASSDALAAIRIPTLVLHGGADDYKSDPAGSAGPRLQLPRRCLGRRAAAPNQDEVRWGAGGRSVQRDWDLAAEPACAVDNHSAGRAGTK